MISQSFRNYDKEISILKKKSIFDFKAASIENKKIIDEKFGFGNSLEIRQKFDFQHFFIEGKN